MKESMAYKKRIFDIVFCLSILPIIACPMALIAVAVFVTSGVPVLYWSDRVGKDNCIFRMPKFRSMRNNAPEVSTDLLQNSSQWLTPIGSFLRKSSLDELPQLWSILKGDMSLVGPRPALYNQVELITLRTENGLHKLKPGLTGLAQVRGRNNHENNQKIAFDVEYLNTKRNIVIEDMQIIKKTVLMFYFNFIAFIRR